MFFTAFLLRRPGDIAIIIASRVLENILGLIIGSLESAGSSKEAAYTSKVQDQVNGFGCYCPCGDTAPSGHSFCHNCQGYIDWQASLDEADPDYDPAGDPGSWDLHA